MNQSLIDTLFRRNKEITEFLADSKQVTFETDVSDTFRKVLVLSIASFFEQRVKDLLFRFVVHNTASEIIPEFVKNKALERQYHTFFNWEAKNANSFFGLFGSEFKAICQEKIGNDEKLNEAVRSFLELGHTRNQLVHMNFASFQLPKSDEEYYVLYKNAALFVDFLEDLLESEAKKGV